MKMSKAPNPSCCSSAHISDRCANCRLLTNDDAEAPDDEEGSIPDYIRGACETWGISDEMCQELWDKETHGGLNRTHNSFSGETMQEPNPATDYLDAQAMVPE